MKINELQVGKKYRAAYGSNTSKNIYKIGENGKLYYKTSGDNNRWSESIAEYNIAINTVFEEYKEPIDWSKVEVDTKIMVKNKHWEKWLKRRFAKFENEKVCAWDDGADSWTSETERSYKSWDEARFPEEGEL